MVSSLAHMIVNILLSLLSLHLFCLGETELWLYCVGVLVISLGVQGYLVWKV